MNRYITFLLLLLAAFSSATAQPVIQWQQSYGGTMNDGFIDGNNENDHIDNTLDGGYIFAGYSLSDDGDVSGHHGTLSEEDVWVMKVDSLGGFEWQISLGGTAADIGQGIRSTSDGGYIVIAETYSDDGDVTGYHPPVNPPAIGGDFWLVKLDAAGNILWEHAFGGEGYDVPYGVTETYDGNYVVVGRTGSNDGDVFGNHDTVNADIWFIKVSNTGSLLWQKCIGGSGGDYAYTVRETSDHGFILSGDVGSADGDFTGAALAPFSTTFVMKTDSLANVEWFQTFGGMLIEWGFDVTETSDGGYAAGINTASPDAPNSNGMMDFWFIRMDSVGNVLWQDCYGGTDHDFFRALQQTNDDGFILVGGSKSIDGDVTGNHGFFDAWAIKIDALGGIEWQRSLGGSEYDEASSVIITPDGGIMIGAEAMSGDGDVGGHHGPTTTIDIWLVKLSPIPTGLNEPTGNIASFSIAPNPVTSNAVLNFELTQRDRIRVELFDISGRLVHAMADRKMSAGTHTIDLDADALQLENGIYLVRVAGSNSVMTTKLIKN
jgi:hypothetical protein